ncbi:MAG: response regulator transcription factor [Fusobacterium sp.]|uniref:response regulator transcription factor n=1 Tax=Fusobacterium sp. TaxID=68766 RepID=UPI0026DC7490|nr:response regulator transcription factor [Fusobacterium sp.]MDO4689960.1 response regulator transcription factor [Fusobacterium sp.]
MNVLIVHEDQGTINYLKTAFKEEVIITDFAQNFVEALEKYYLNPYDIIIMDSRVKNIDAKFFCEKVRNHNNKVGLICLSSDGNFDLKIDLFKAGIDDFILKPFKFTELLYRIKSLYRRVEFTEIVKEINLCFQDFKLDMMSRKLTRNENIIELTQKEFALIELLVRNKNLALSRTYIREKVWGIDFINNTNIVDVYINKIRNKINDYEGKILQSVRGYGYILKG